MTSLQIPTNQDLLWPTLKALETKNGSASIQELLQQMAADLALPGEVLDTPHLRNGRPTSLREFNYRAAWSRTYLKNAGLIENVSLGRGIWVITEKGRAIQNEDEVRKLARPKAAGLSNGGTPVVEPPDWKEDLLDIVRSIDPSAFERLCGLMLRKSGFTSVEITGRSGDGGIDGVGVLRVNLISFHMLFQCKRFSGAVGAGAIRDFRGAMVGRADKGLFITTGSFTRDAEREAVRAGAPPIDLIDGGDLCDQLKDLRLGVRMVEVPELVRDFFSHI